MSSVVVSAAARGDLVVTSDPRDIALVADALGAGVVVEEVRGAGLQTVC